MKCVKEEILIEKGWGASQQAHDIQVEIRDAISKVVWPVGTNTFTIRKVKHGSGVTPIKKEFVAHLESLGWKSEHNVRIGGNNATAGCVDVARQTSNSLFAVEWETGNISSSHRSLNKLALGILDKKIVGGALIIPSRELYPWITDRIGNFGELQPYLTFWKRMTALVDDAFLSIFVVEHDKATDDVNIPLIPKGNDGRAREGRENATRNELTPRMNDR